MKAQTIGCGCLAFLRERQARTLVRQWTVPAEVFAGVKGGVGPNLSSEVLVAESVYKVIELIGTSTESWEKAATAAIKRASKTLRDLRVAEISQLDMQLKDGKVQSFRAKVKVSFKFEGAD